MGDTLPNGATVLDRRPLTDRAGLLKAEIVLCHIPHNRHTPYATWQRNIEEDATYWGHYFDDRYDAEADFKTRGR